MSTDYLARALRDSSFFKGIADDDRQSLITLGVVRHLDAGAALFRPGQRPSGLFLVLEGVIEICRAEVQEGELLPVVYLGRGAVLAESKVITGTPYQSLARFPEGGAVFHWPRPTILRRLYEDSQFAMQYLHNLARRLEGSFANLGPGDGRELSGSLERFDLATILQTIVESSAAGLLDLRDARGDNFGAIYTKDRLLKQMRCGVLTGAEAFYEILLSPPPRGTFTFKSGQTGGDTDHSYELQPLLLEAARIADEMHQLEREVPGSNLLRRASLQLSWTGQCSGELAEQIWNELAVRKLSWEDLGPKLKRSRGSVAAVVREMLEAGLLTVDSGTAVARR
jgi:CRP-like cAMP-binding protein